MPPMLKTRVRIKDNKERQRRLEIVAKASRGSYAKVGIIDADATYPGSDITVGQVAAWMEFGTNPPEGRTKGGTPMRSFLRAPVDAAKADLNKVRQRTLEDIISGRMAIADALQTLGFFLSNVIKNTIIRGIDPPLAERTREMKRTNRANKGVSATPDSPLQDTKMLIQHVGYEVVLRGGGGE